MSVMAERDVASTIVRSVSYVMFAISNCRYVVVVWPRGIGSGIELRSSRKLSLGSCIILLEAVAFHIDSRIPVVHHTRTLAGILQRRYSRM